jgi:hypothetical protein
LVVAVPGGQESKSGSEVFSIPIIADMIYLIVYIAPDGALSYTAPHSAYKPDGSITTGFWRVISEAGGAPVVWGFHQGNTVACPVNGTSGVYQIYISINGSHSGCAAFEGRSYTLYPSTVSAWEY